jgi:hypothetical protein
MPGVPVRNFELGRTFDVVTCLFGSVGYVQTVDALHSSIASMERHLAPGGVLILEPWLTPDGFDPSHPTRAMIVERPGLAAARLNDSRVEGRLSIMDFHYLVVRPGARMEHLVETHALGLFTNDEVRGAFEAAGLSAEHDPEGLIGRGLWVACRASRSDS